MPRGASEPLLKSWPLVAALALLWLAIASVVRSSVRQNDGRLVYALDDTYISMAIGRNLAEHGVWGVSRHEFTSASSSILWPLLLGLCHRLGLPPDATPLLLNALCASFVLALACFALRDRLRSGLLFLTLTALVFVIPLPLLAVIGLEHTVHLLLALATVWLGARRLANREPPGPALLLLVALLVGARYEGLFLAGVLGLLFFLRRGWRSAALLAGAALLPVGVYGLISVINGWHFLPNSLLLKAPIKSLLQDLLEHGLFSRPGLGAVAHLCGFKAYTHLVSVPSALVLLLWALVAWASGRGGAARLTSAADASLVLFMGTTVLHMQFASVGYLFRYEAYLLGLGVFVLALGWKGPTPGIGTAPIGLPLAALSLLTVFALGHRIVETQSQAPQAMRNIYEQQYQMGLFLRKHYQGARVLAHDIGAINYLADVRCTDIVGLGTKEVFDLKVAGALNEGAIARLGRSVDLAVVYDRHLGRRGRVPAGWTKVGEWTIPNNVICAEPTVQFFATDARRASELQGRLREFSAELPGDVTQAGLYTPSATKGETGP